MKLNCDRISDKELMHTVPPCKDNYPDKMPNVYFYTPEDVVFYPYDPKTFKKRKVLETNDDPNKLDSMIYRYMPTFAKRIRNMEDFNQFMENFDAINRAIYFANENEPPRYFKGLTSYFKDRLEFAYVTPDALEVSAYFNMTVKPRWVVLKKNGPVGYEPRKYIGKRNFEDLRTYLTVFAEKTPKDRRGTNYKKKMRERASHLSHTLKYQDFDHYDFDRNIDFPDEIVFLHITDSLSMDYPNLNIFQKFYG